jgi:hypothetical protein
VKNNFRAETECLCYLVTPAVGDPFNANGAAAFDTKGNFAGLADVSDHNGLAPDTSISGTYTITSGTDAAVGRGTALSTAFGATAVPFYVISPTKFVIVIPGGPGNDRGVVLIFEQ